MKCEVCGKREADRKVTIVKPFGGEFTLNADARCALWLIGHSEGRFAANFALSGRFV
jgi:hypothetical protein